jgi:hypothetical protein
LKHFDRFTIRQLKFIDGKLPRGITNEQAQNSEFAITSHSKNWLCGFELERGKEKYKDRFENELKVFWNDDEPAPLDDDATKEKTSVYKLRNESCKAWLESESPQLDKMTKAQIESSLKNYNSQLWSHGFNDWYRQQSLITLKTGRKPTNRINQNDSIHNRHSRIL